MTITVPVWQGKFAAMDLVMGAVIVPHPFLCLIYLEGFGDLWNLEGWKGSATSSDNAYLMRAADMRVHTCVSVNTQ